jgi:hypothetical protein
VVDAGDAVHDVYVDDRACVRGRVIAFA